MTDDSDSQDRERILKAKYEVWQYRDDGSKYLDDVESVNAVPIEELEALADEWESANTSENLKPAAVGALTACSEELREAIAENRGEDE